MMLAYHELSSVRERDVYALPAETFQSHLGTVRAWGDALDCITFDDGHSSQFEFAAPILDSMNLTARFFITTAWVGHLSSVMSWSELRQLEQAGHCIGSHTHTHPLLTGCGPAALRNELLVSRHILEDHLGHAVDTISMPGGRIDTCVIRACGESGYRRIYTSRVAQHEKASNAMPEVIGRLVVRSSTSDHTLAGYLRGDLRVCRRLQWESDIKSLAKKIIGDSFYQRLWRHALRSGVYGS